MEETTAATRCLLHGINSGTVVVVALSSLLPFCWLCTYQCSSSLQVRQLVLLLSITVPNGKMLKNSPLSISLANFGLFLHVQVARHGLVMLKHILCSTKSNAVSCPRWPFHYLYRRGIDIHLWYRRTGLRNRIKRHILCIPFYMILYEGKMKYHASITLLGHVATSFVQRLCQTLPWATAFDDKVKSWIYAMNEISFLSLT